MGTATWGSYCRLDNTLLDMFAVKAAVFLMYVGVSLTSLDCNCAPGERCVDTGKRCFTAPCPGVWQCVKTCSPRTVGSRCLCGDTSCNKICEHTETCVDTGARCFTFPCCAAHTCQKRFPYFY